MLVLDRKLDQSILIGGTVDALETMHTFLRRWCAGHNVRG